MTKTARDLFNETLSEINVLEAGQDASAEDFDKVKNLFKPLLDMLNARRDFYLAPDLPIEDTVIPDEAFIPLMRLFALVVGPSFGKPPIARRDLEEAIAYLRLVTLPAPNYATLPACYF